MQEQNYARSHLLCQQQLHCDESLRCTSELIIINYSGQELILLFTYMLCKYIGIFREKPLIYYPPFMLSFFKVGVWIQEKHFFQLQQKKISMNILAIKCNKRLVRNCSCIPGLCRKSLVNTSQHLFLVQQCFGIGL